MADEQDKGDAPDETNEAAPTETGGRTPYEKAAAEGNHLDTGARGTNFAPDLVVGAGIPAIQGNPPAGDYYALKKIRDKGRAAHFARLAEQAAEGQPHPSTLTQGGLATTFEQDAAGNVVQDSVRILGVVPTPAPTVVAGVDVSSGGTTGQATGADGQPRTDSTPTAADVTGGRETTR